MSSVDERIVSMKIDNRQFLPGVKASQAALNLLNRTVDSAGNTKGMANLGAAVDTVHKRFTMLNYAALVAVGTITHRLVSAGINMVKALTIDPVMAGFQSYETQINATKTIMANTGASAKQTAAALKDLQHYANLTVYNFADMAKNIGTFTAAGVKLKPATEAIKGIADLGAMSGSSAQQVSSAMYQLSQALAAGQVHLQDWNSVVNAGMGGKIFQTALARTAANMGTLSSATVKYAKDGKLASIAGNSFRQSIQSKPGQNSWLTSAVLAKTLGQFSIDISTARARAKSFKSLIDQGYSPKAANDILKLAKSAQSSATNIKTWSQLTDALKEEVATAWGQIFKTIFGGLGQATKLFSALHTTMENALTGPLYSFNKVLEGWKNLGGRTAVIQGFVNIWHALGDVFHAIGKAWDEAFPASGKRGQTLADLSKGFESLTAHLVPSQKTIGDITKLFKGLFDILGTADHIVGSIFSAFFNFLGLFKGSGAGGGLAALAGSLGTLLSAISGFGDNKVDAANKKISGFFGELQKAGPTVAAIAHTIGQGLSAIGQYVENLVKGLKGSDVSTVLGGLFAGGVFLMIKKFMGSLTELVEGGHGILSSIKGVFSGLTESMEAMQQNVKSTAMLKIAGAVGILALSLLVLSNIPSAKLEKGLMGVAALMGELVGAIALMSKVNKSFSLVLMATSLDLLAAAILALSVAVAAFGSMDPKTIAKGLAGIGASILVLTGAASLLSKYAGSFILTATSLGILSVALDLLAGTIELYGHFDMKTVGKGLLSMGLALETIGIAMRTMPGGVKMVLQAAALAGIAAAITVLAGAVELLGHMSMEQLGKGLGAMAVGLGILVIALNSLSGWAVVGAAGLLIATTALAGLTAVLVTLGHMSLGSLVKGVLGLAAALGVLIAAGALAEAVAPGLLALGAAVALLGAGVAAAGLGVGALAAGLGVLAGVGSAGIAVLIHAIGAFLKLLPEIAIQGAKALGDFLGTIGAHAPQIAHSIGQMITALLREIDKLSPQLRRTMNIALGNMLNVIDTNLPKLRKTMTKLINNALDVLDKAVPRFVRSAVSWIMAILTGIDNNITKIVNKASDIVVHFLNGIANNEPRIIRAGSNIIIKFLQGLGQNAGRIMNQAGKTILQFLQGLDAAVNQYMPQITQEGVQIGKDVLAGVAKGLADATGLSSIAGAAEGAAKAGLGALKGAAGFLTHSPSKKTEEIGKWAQQGLANGLSNKDGLKAIGDASAGMARKSLSSTKKTVQTSASILKEVGASIPKGFLAGINSQLKNVAAAGAQMAQETVDTISKTTTLAQLKADAQQAKAQAYRDAAAQARADERTKKLSKAEKTALANRAKELDKQAQAAQKAADVTQGGINAAAAKHAADQRWNAADAQGRADIRNQQATNAAKAAEQDRQKALEAAQAADLIRARDAKRAAELDKQAKQALANANKAAEQSKKAAIDANHWAAKAAVQQAKTVQAQLDADNQAAAVAVMTDQQKVDYYNQIQTKQKQLSDQLYAKAQQLLTQSAKENAKQAQKDIAKAQQDVTDAEAAKQAADDAASSAQQAASDAGQSATDASTTLSGLQMPQIDIASSAVFNAQNMFDAYTKALAATQQLAANDAPPTIQFVQNNTSPTALSPTQIYRQTGNLLSNAERKLAGALSP